MSAPSDPSARERQEIDEFHRRLGHSTHYELLGVDRRADTDTIRRAYQTYTQRFSPQAFSSPLTNASMQRLEAIQEALDTALAILGDPVRRYLYDQDLDARQRSNASSTRPNHISSNSKGTPLPGVLQHPLQPLSTAKRTSVSGTLYPTVEPRPSRLSSPALPRTPTPTEGFRAPVPPSPIAPQNHASIPGDPLGVLHPPPPLAPASPATSALPPPSLQATTPPPVEVRHDSPPSAPTPAPFTAVPPEPASAHRVPALEAQVQTLQKEVTALLAEVERLAVAIQLTIARQLEPHDIHADQLVAAGQALVSSRVTLATLLAQREESAGRWEVASTLWQRAFRARPTDVKLLVNAANALRKANTDLDGAEALARQAVALDPDDPDAQSALAVIEAKRRPAP